MTENAAANVTLPESLAVALRRLAAALDKLDAACERRAKADALRANLEEELAVMQDDRARLAVELDGALARVKSLELAHEEISRKLSHARGEIAAVLSEAAMRES
ncbi:MAG TPA: DUF4164 family protein [Methylocella sp.]|nr:DUF4164 family protein [Methylocella sp.]